MLNKEDLFKNIIAHAKEYGFVFQSSWSTNNNMPSKQETQHFMMLLSFSIQTQRKV